MTLKEKIERLKHDAADQQVSRSTVAPPIARALWGLHLDVPPPLLWPFVVKAAFDGLVFAAIIFALDRLPYWSERRHGFVHYLGAAVFFGLFMALLSRWRSK